MTPQQIAKAAQAKIKKHPELEASMRTAWAPVEEMIDALASTYVHRNYAFQRMHKLGRLEMLTRFIDGADPTQCALSAINAVETDYSHHLSFGGAGNARV